MTISDEQIAQMLAGLEGVTPGPWVAASNYSIHRVGDMYSEDGFVEALDGYCVEAPTYDDHVTRRAAIEKPEDAAHIARLDPDTVRALLTELEQTRAENKRLRDITVRAQYLVPEWNVNWHEDARATLSKENDRG